VLEEALKKYQGTIVLISHDRHLINAVCNKVAYVEGGRVTLCPGNFDDFHRLWKHRLDKETPPAAKESAAPAVSQDAADKAPRTSGPKTAAQKRAEAEARNALHQKLKPMKRELEKVENQLSDASGELEGLVARMADPASYADPARWSELSQAHDKAKARVDKLSTRWEELALKLEELEAAQAQA
jgi:ATP-binding cassette subfamily F protein 3